MQAFVESHDRALRVGMGASFLIFLMTQMAVWTGWGRQFHALGTHALAALLLTICLIAMQVRRPPLPILEHSLPIHPAI
jgi:hypothetical protein